jgi:hypothetical protein
MTTTSVARLRSSLAVIGVTQLLLGLAFLLVPASTEHLFALRPPAPAWAHWLLAMMAARFIGYAAGMAVAFRDPGRHVGWINTMILIQVVDWVATLAFLTSGALSMRQVGPAAVLPVLFVGALLWWHPGRARHA